MTTATLTRAAGLRIVQATRTMVIACADDENDEQVTVYVATPVGWRQGVGIGRRVGELVVDPTVIAQLDRAALAA